MGDRKNWKKLASIPVGDGKEAAIWLDDDGKATDMTGGNAQWMIGSPPDPFVTEVPDGTLVFGDLLPGACQVEIRAPVEPRGVVVAGGQFLALIPARLEKGEVFAIFRDDEGAIVHRAIPDELKRTPITDTTVLCPACGETAWDRVETRAEPEMDFTRWRMTVCRHCGRPEGGIQSAGRRRRGRSEPAEDEWELASSNAPDPSKPAEVIRASSFDVYGIDPALAGKRLLYGFGWANDAVDNVSVSYKRKGVNVEVETRYLHPSSVWDAPARAKLGLRHMLWKMRPRLSVEADELSQADQRRKAIRAPVEVIELAVDGQPMEFTVVSDLEVGWYAVACLTSTWLGIEARGIEPAAIRLMPIRDPETYFA